MKNSFLIIVIVFTSLISCKQKIEKKNINTDNHKKMDNSEDAPYNISEIGDGLKYNYDTLSIEYIKKIKASLTSKNFIFLDEIKFKEKILEVFSFKIDDYKNNIIVLRPAMFKEVVIKDEKFVLIEDPESDATGNVNSNLEYYYNLYVLHDDKFSFNWLKTNNKEALVNLVVEYGYNKDKELLKFVFKDFDFDNQIAFHDLIFSRELTTNRFKLREGLINDIENIVYDGGIDGYDQVKEGNGYNSLSDIVEAIRKSPNEYVEPEKTIAFLYEKYLRIGVTGYIESNLLSDSNYKSFLMSKNYFNNIKLKNYVENVFGENSNSDRQIIYKINDSDGYTNLRKEKNSTSIILEKVKNGEAVEILDDSGNWWLIETKTGKKGYVYKTKIVSE